MDMTKCSTCIKNKGVSQELILNSCTFDTNATVIVPLVTQTRPYIDQKPSLVELSGVDSILIELITISHQSLRRPVFFMMNSIVLMRNIQIVSNYNQYPIIQLEKSDIFLIDSIYFIKNSGLFSSVVCRDGNITFNGTIFFSGNEVFGNGGAISIFGESYLNFNARAVKHYLPRKLCNASRRSNLYRL